MTPSDYEKFATPKKLNYIHCGALFTPNGIKFSLTLIEKKKPSASGVQIIYIEQGI